jgi:hypothetical protein
VQDVRRNDHLPELARRRSDIERIALALNHLFVLKDPTKFELGSVPWNPIKNSQTYQSEP